MYLLLCQRISRLFSALLADEHNLHIVVLLPANDGNNFSPNNLLLGVLILS